MTTDNIVYKIETTDRTEFEQAFRGVDCLLVLWRIDEWLRNKIKYEDIPENEREVYEITRDELRDIMRELGVSFDLLT